MQFEAQFGQTCRQAISVRSQTSSGLMAHSFDLKERHIFISSNQIAEYIAPYCYFPTDPVPKI